MTKENYAWFIAHAVFDETEKLWRCSTHNDRIDGNVEHRHRIGNDDFRAIPATHGAGDIVTFYFLRCPTCPSTHAPERVRLADLCHCDLSGPRNEEGP